MPKITKTTKLDRHSCYIRINNYISQIDKALMCRIAFQVGDEEGITSYSNDELINIEKHLEAIVPHLIEIWGIVDDKSGRNVFGVEIKET